MAQNRRRTEKTALPNELRARVKQTYTQHIYLYDDDDDECVCEHECVCVSECE